MKALKFIINEEEQEIPHGGGDGIGRTLYVNYDEQTSHWVLVSNQHDTPTINDIQNNVVLVIQGDAGQILKREIYDSDGNSIRFSKDPLCDWNAIDNNGILLGIIKKLGGLFIFYPRYGGTIIMN